MFNAEEIIDQHDLIGLARLGKHQEVLDILNKYPEQRGTILKAMLIEALSEPPQLDAATDRARKEMLGQANNTCVILEAMNEGFDLVGRSPLINDMGVYDGVTAEVAETLVAEDMAMGLRLYNACAKYIRTYNANKEV